MDNQWDLLASDYTSLFQGYGYKEVYLERPGFTPDFLAQHSMPFSTKEPEYLIQGFRKDSPSL
ncbi:MAG: hypothetical protein ACFB0D_20340 [Phormidesmis sp.]